MSHLDIRRAEEGETADDGSHITDGTLRDWAHGKKTLVLGDDQDYLITWATSSGSQQEVFDRMTLCAEMISDPEVPNEKKNSFLNILYYRLWQGLRADGRTQPSDQQKQQGSITLEWCETRCKDSYHPVVQEFCKNAKELLGNWDKYNLAVFDFDKWGYEQIMSAREKWLPFE